MNKKLALYTAFLSLLSPFLTGCMCTMWTNSHIAGYACHDKFKPEAVYRREKPVSFALEGTRETRRGSSHAFLIVEEDLLKRAHAQTNETLSVEDIQKAYEALAFDRDETRRRIPPDYIRVAVLPRNDIALDVGVYYPGWGWNFLLPVAFIVDIPTFPLQAIFVAAGGDPGWRM